MQFGMLIPSSEVNYGILVVQMFGFDIPFCCLIIRSFMVSAHFGPIAFATWSLPLFVWRCFFSVIFGKLPVIGVPSMVLCLIVTAAAVIGSLHLFWVELLLQHDYG